MHKNSLFNHIFVTNLNKLIDKRLQQNYNLEKQRKRVMKKQESRWEDG